MKRKIDSLTAITIRVTAIALAFWLLMMGLITLGGVRDINAQLEREAKAYHLSGISAAEPNWSYWKVYSLFTLKWGIDLELNFPFALERDLGIDPAEDKFFGYDAALVMQSKDGSTVKSGPYYYFPYWDEADWAIAAEEDRTKRFCVVDLSDFPEGGMLAEKIGTGLFDGTRLYNFRTVRFTGYFEGEWFCPVTMDLYPDRLESAQKEKPKRWQNVFTREAETDRELVTIYTNELSGVNYDGEPVTLDGVRYDSLVDCLEAFVESGGWEEISAGITDSVVMLIKSYRTEGEQRSATAIAIRINPLLYSVSLLWPVYVSTLVILAAMVALLIFKIRRELTEPVRQVNLLARGLPLPEGKAYEPRWQEPYELEQIVQDTRQALHETKAQNRQLQTALEYAKNAEEYRRRMISGLTHELKTPLAVIHSYAEGLKEGIAKEKEEQYLSVILEESEKMDAMVLQMLDLSRLEAGRVQLSADRFSLAELTRSVFDKMMPLAEEKNLTVSFTMPNACELTADEGRITQVVTNLASNAIKYTPEGGTISVIVYGKKENNILCVENTCERLSDEALGKVWDSFYRGDAARTTEGTGLGLTIVKTIVELHGGNCQVFNTPTGVQFQIVLP